MGHGLSSARSAVREPNYGPEGEIEWELRPWIAGFTEVAACGLYRKTYFFKTSPP